MTGRNEVHRLTQRLDATFARAKLLGHADSELLADFARYLVILVSGFLENALVEIVLDHARKGSRPSVQRFVQSRLKGQTNMKCQRILDLLGSLDETWRKELEGFLVDEKKDAVDSVIALRNAVAHGEHAGGVTVSRISGYYQQIQLVVRKVADLCDPL